jgi:hypothetical protein
MRELWKCVALAMPFLITAPGAAHAQDRPDTGRDACDEAPTTRDVVCLKDGTVMRGTLVEVTPQVGARLMVAEGAPISSVPWDEVSRIRYARGSPLRVGSPVASVWVHLDGAPDARLEADTGANGDWVEVCATPCDQFISAGRSYRIAGDGIKASRDFELRAPAGGRERIRVGPASKKWFGVGLVLTGAGIVVSSLGGAILYLRYAFAALAGVPSADVDPTPGLALVGIGVALAAPGLALLLPNQRTSITQEIDRPTSPPSAKEGAMSLLEGIPSAAERRRLPSVVTLPIVGVRFWDESLRPGALALTLGTLRHALQITLG